jgi:hypothetical protein
MLFPGTWGKMIHKKTGSKKSCDTVPLMPCLTTYVYTYIVPLQESTEDSKFVLILCLCAGKIGITKSAWLN